MVARSVGSYAKRAIASGDSTTRDGISVLFKQSGRRKNCDKRETECERQRDPRSNLYTGSLVLYAYNREHFKPVEIYARKTYLSARVRRSTGCHV